MLTVLNYIIPFTDALLFSRSERASLLVQWQFSLTEMVERVFIFIYVLFEDFVSSWRYVVYNYRNIREQNAEIM
jgi:hypothetical protein